MHSPPGARVAPLASAAASVVRMRPRPASTVPSVLVVEDCATDERLIHALLDRLGCAYDVALDGEQAVLQAVSGKYDLVFMDLELPGLDGLGATRLIHARMGARSPRIVALTAHEGQEVRRDGLEAGVDYFLHKPVRLESLRSLLLDV